MKNTPRAIVAEFRVDKKASVAQVKPYTEATRDAIHFRYGAWNIAYNEFANIIYAEDTRLGGLVGSR